MVGTLLDVGTGKTKPDYIKEIFKQNERVFAGRKIPPHSLYLERVEYTQDKK